MYLDELSPGLDADWMVFPVRSMTAAELQQELDALPSIDPCLPGAQDVSAMNARQRRLEILFKLAKRDKPGSPNHGLLTGLHAQASS